MIATRIGPRPRAASAVTADSLELDLDRGAGDGHTSPEQPGNLNSIGR